ncbi:MAG TPA: substrate-binding domain-containing protein, partial [Polyangia bacterium]
MTKWNRNSGIRGMILPTTLAAAATGVGFAAWGAGPYINAGSDTLGDVAPYTITQSGANLTYKAMGSGEGEKRALNHTQSIAFMSRNFKASVLAAGAHPDWQPGVNNVLGLDACVMVEQNYPARMQNLAIPEDPNAPSHGLPDSDLSLLLSGKGGTGTTAACRHADRMAALDRITTALHVAQIDHFLRRNDASGTSDTIRER